MKKQILLFAAILLLASQFIYSQINYEMVGTGSSNQILQVDKLSVSIPQQLIMKPSAITDDNGNIGIGVSPATEKLHVAGSILADDDIYGTNINADVANVNLIQSSIPGTNNLLLKATSSSSSNKFLIGKTGNYILGVIPDPPYVPESMFEIVNNDVSKFSMRIFNYSIDEYGKGLQIQSNGLYATHFQIKQGNDLIFDVHDGGDVYFGGTLIKSNGNPFRESQWNDLNDNIYYIGENVGIGKYTPDYKLDVDGTIKSTGLILSDGSQGLDKILVSDPNGIATWTDPSSIDDGDWTESTSNNIYHPNGNVGIGVDPNPLSKFHIQDDSPSIQLRSTTIDNYNGIFMNHSESGGHWEWFAGTPQDNAHNFIIACQETSNHNPSTATSANAKFTISDEGWVGIGTAPEWETALTVNGEINATTLNVDYFNTGDLTINDDLSVTGLLTAGEILVVGVDKWKDEVFYDDYPLLSISQVSQFIQENGHLPEIPPEDVILSEGYNISEMDALLLQKIEELTLYIIELEELYKISENIKL